MAHVVCVDDLRDPRLAEYSNLRSDPIHSSATGSFIVEGRWCLQRLAESRHAVRHVLVERGRESVAAEIVSDSTPVYSLPGDQMRKLVGFDFHRGLLACGERPPLSSINQLQLGGEHPRLALVALGINQRENLGSMMRSAAAFGVRDILIDRKSADPYSRRAVRVSMATVLKQTVYDLDHPAEQLTWMSSSRGYRTVVTTLGQDATPLDQLVRDERPIVLVVGNEADGIEADIQAAATDRVTIPMQLGTDSLNVAVAAAVLLYQLRGD